VTLIYSVAVLTNDVNLFEDKIERHRITEAHDAQLSYIKLLRNITYLRNICLPEKSEKF